MARSGAQEMRVQPNYTYGRAQGVLTNASAALLTAGTSGTILVDKIIITEKSNASRTYTLRHLESGGTDDATADLFQAAALAALETVLHEGGGPEPLLILKDGDALKGLASANTAVNYYIGYRTQV